MVYESISDALRQLIMLRERGGIISRSPRRIMILSNGEPYYYVEVTCRDGGHYVIEVIGRDAIELMEECTKIRGQA
jgi:hypothetical protein